MSNNSPAFNPNSLDALIAEIRLRLATLEENFKDLDKGVSSVVRKDELESVAGRLIEIRNLVDRLEISEAQSRGQVEDLRGWMERVEDVIHRLEGERNGQLEILIIGMESLKEANLSLCKELKTMTPTIIAASILTNAPIAAAISFILIILAQWTGVPTTLISYFSDK